MGRVLYFAYHRTETDIEPPTLTTLNFNSKTSEELTNDYNELKFKYVETISIGEKKYRKYNCRFFVHKNKVVYIEGSKLNGYEIPYNFYAYKPLGLDVIFFDVKTNIGKKFISIVNKRAEKIVFEEYVFNLEDVLKKVRTVTFTWFRMDDSTRISSHALGGYNINGTPEYSELSNHSVKSSIEFEYNYKGIAVTPYISKKNSIFLRTSFDPREIEINIVVQVFLDLIL